MLSHQDVHYLTGLLQIVTSPKSVEVELGSMVFDDAIEAERDVDVTVKYRTTDNIHSVLVGIEVKDHSRPLDVTHVEQLGAKLIDMTAITSRAIVSASGYTGAAIRKAAAHSLKLFELEEWDPNNDVFPTRMTQLKTVSERILGWEKAEITFNPDEPTSAELQAVLESNPQLVTATGTQLETPQNVSGLIELLVLDARAHVARDPEIASLPAGERRTIAINVEVADRPCLQLTTGPRALAMARIEGDLFWIEHRHVVHFRRLVDVTDGRRPVAGCGLAAMSTGELIGLTTSNFKNRGSVIHISAADRKKAMIRRQRLR